jgi:hypothetical protein
MRLVQSDLRELGDGPPCLRNRRRLHVHPQRPTPPPLWVNTRLVQSDLRPTMEWNGNGHQPLEEDVHDAPRAVNIIPKAVGGGDAPQVRPVPHSGGS